MPGFDYQAVDAAGRRQRGVVSAPSEREARADLVSRQLTPIRLVPADREAPRRRFAWGASGRLGAKDLALVTRQLATLVTVTPVEEALRMIALQADSERVRQVLLVTHGAVLEGFRLSGAMGRSPLAFPPLYRAMVAAGEGAGALPAILERLADLLESEQQAQGKVIAALVYPIALALTAAVVILALMTFVVPKVVDQFASMGQTLPLLTQVVIGISHGLRDWGWLLALVLVLGALGFARGLRHEPFRLRVDRWVLDLPMVGRLLRDLHAARLSRTLATMVAAQLPLLEGLAITAPTVRNRVLRGATEQLVATIREGGSLSAGMRRAAVFPPLLVNMIASGESSGRVELMLSRAADYLEREFNTYTSVALSLLEPAIIVVMGGVVAVIVLSILLPILQINTMALN